MSDRVALKIAIDLLHVPTQVRLFRLEPLPDGVLTLLRIAAGDEEAENLAVAFTGRSKATVRHAAMFFIEQILFAPNANSYRVLGADPQASANELRRNLALLLRWLHPDLDPRGERSVFVGRVTAAWNNLKTPERRTAYQDLVKLSGNGTGSRSHGGRPRSERSGKNRRFTPGFYRSRRLPTFSMMPRQRVGFLRRALLVLFHRPLQ